MAGYPEIDDEPAHASRKWLTQVLRQELGFDGLVESEGYGFQTLIDEGIVPTQKEAGALALQAGVDLNITYEPAYMGPLVQNVEEGRVPVSLVDLSVRRLLREKFRLGLFEHPYVDPNQAVRIVHSQEHQDLALDVAREGIVLLKNEQNLLPLKKNLTSIAVIGPDADSSSNQLGDYTSRKVLQPVVTVLQGIRERVGPQTKVYYAKGSNVLGNDKSGFQDAVQAAKRADVAVVVVGEQFGRNESNQKERSATDGEGSDVASLDLAGVQEDLVQAVSATGTPVVVVLINGRPLSVRWEAAHVPALVEAWEPGERGGTAVADVLFGDYNPSGRLPITIPRSSAQLPAYYDCKPSKVFWVKKGWSKNYGYVDMPSSPLYPFGYGLSYTRFSYRNLVVDTPQIHPGGDAHVHVEVKNVGDRSGVETVQLYTHERFAPVSTAIQQLHGFQRVALGPGESKTVSFTLTPEDLMLLDLNMHWSVVPGTFDIMVGDSSADVPLTATLEVTP
jgi:beta-glucosidase